MRRIHICAWVLAISFWLTDIVLAAEDTPISLRLNNAEVNTVLRTMATMGNVSLVVDDSVTGKITLQLDQVPFAQALDIITKTKNLAVQKIGNTLIVATPEKIHKGFDSVHIIKLQYVNFNEINDPSDPTGKSGKSGKDIKEEIKKSLELIATKGKIEVDASSNCVVFIGTPDEFSIVEQAVAQLDRQLARQVVIEAEVIEMNKDALKDVGFSYDFKTIPYLDPAPDVKSYEDDNGTKHNMLVYPDKTHQRLKLFTVNGESINIGVQATLHAKIDKGEGKVLAKPRIMALNNQDAKIHIGNKVPVVQYDNDGNKSIDYIEVGIKLDIIPQINDDNTIVSKVKTEVSDAAYNQTAGGYEISTRQSETTVRLKDGETLVIGGLYNSSEHKSTLKVPFLGDIPLLGNLFKSTTTEKHDTEIIVLLKPTIAPNR